MISMTKIDARRQGCRAFTDSPCQHRERGRKKIQEHPNKETDMSRQSNVEKIHEIAKTASGPIKLSELAAWLGYSTPRSVAPRVSSAHLNHDDEGNAAACEIIAGSFVDRNGNYVWWL